MGLGDDIDNLQALGHGLLRHLRLREPGATRVDERATERHATGAPELLTVSCSSLQTFLFC